MRRASFKIDNQVVDGYWSLDQYRTGEFYEFPITGKLVVVETVFEGEFFTGDGRGYFYRLRPATEGEVEEYNKPINPEAEKKMFDDFFSVLDN